jgi:hypothetical protein
MKQSESIKELATALSKVQGQLTFAKKDNANPFFKSKYADLASVWESCRTLLSENGLAIMQFPSGYETNVIDFEKFSVEHLMSLTTVITHSSGEWISQEMTLPVTKADAQGAGSAITYMRRYSLAAVVGVYQDDDDGNGASSNKESLTPKERPATLTTEELDKIAKLAVDTNTEVSNIAKFYGKKDIKEVERLHFAVIVEQLEKKIAKALHNEDKEQA